MARALWLASVFALTACYPDFQFGSSGAGGDSTGRSSASTANGRGGDTAGPSTTTGQGGDPANTVATTSVSTGTGGGATVTSTTTGMMEPTVPCGPSMSGQLHPCMADEVCCYDLDNAAYDTCASANGCDSSAYVFSCNEQSDCPTGSVCCAQFYTFLGVPFFDGAIGCYSSCNSPNRRVCTSSSECGNKTCQPIEDLDASYGTDYRACN